jgi:hypothetical protein
VFTGSKDKRETDLAAARAELDKDHGIFGRAERMKVATHAINKFDTSASAR